MRCVIIEHSVYVDPRETPALTSSQSDWEGKGERADRDPQCTP